MIDLKEFADILNFSDTDIYLLNVLARTKNNEEVTKKDRLLFREPVHNLSEMPHALAKMEALAIHSGLKTYLYISANSRSTIKTYKEFKISLAKIDGQAMDNDKQYLRPLGRLDKEWYSALMQPESRSSKYFVIDIDTKDDNTLRAVREALMNYKIKVRRKEYKVEIKVERETRNGYHFVTTGFDPSILEGIPNVGVSKDGLLYLGCFNFEENNEKEKNY